MRKVWIVTRRESYDGPNAKDVIVAVTVSKKNAETAIGRLARQRGLSGKLQIEEITQSFERPRLAATIEHDHGETVFMAEQYDVSTNKAELNRSLK